jgi:predicted CoA-binding protein
VKVFIIGASHNPERYSYKAAQLLMEHGHDIVPLALKENTNGPFPIYDAPRDEDQAEIITLYVGPKNQADWIPKIINWHPRKVIFNPGTENPEFQQQLTAAGIAWEDACTLVLLQTGQWA